MKFNRFIRPGTAEEALEWARRPGTVILGGMMWLRMQNRTVENAVDLSLLGLDRIEETENGILIGAYTTLRQAETSLLLADYTRGAFAAALAPIVGVQFRNTATIGGSVFGRFGFSDITTLLSALGASVCLADAGTVPMEQFVRNGAPHDILTHILLPKEKPEAVAALAHRNTATDFPVLTTAVCRRGGTIRVSVSPAPLRTETSDFPAQEISGLADRIADASDFRSDRAASAEYRRHLARVLVGRALTSIGG